MAGIGVANGRTELQEALLENFEQGLDIAGRLGRVAAQGALNDLRYYLQMKWRYARGLAQRVMKEGGESAAQRLAYAFRLTLAREPKKNELQILERIYQQQLENFRKDKKAATDLVSVGESPRPAELDVSELAAWTAIGNILLNLDETITKG